MPKIIIIITILGLVAFFVFTKKTKPTESLALDIKGQIFNLEVADTPGSRTIGLSNQNSLCPHCGMIFIYQKEAIYPFWMKNTRIPLDIIWLDSNGKVVDIKTGQPQDLSLLTNSAPARYIIETNPNATNLSVGDTINLVRARRDSPLSQP